MNGRKYPLKFWQGKRNKASFQRGRLAQIALFANHGIVRQMERFKRTKLGYGKKPTCRQF